MNKGPLVIYHGGCIDGFTAAWIFHKYKLVPLEDLFPAFHRPNKGDVDLPEVDGRDVIFVDFCPPRHQLMELSLRAMSVLVLDHHKSDMEDCQDLPFTHFDMTKSGAGLAWEHCMSSYEMPWLVRYVQDRDLWSFELPYSKEINAWIGATLKTMDAWNTLYEEGQNKAFIYGEAALQGIQRYVTEMKPNARRISFAGYDNIPVINAPRTHASELVGELAQDALFAVSWFHRGDGKFQFELRSRGDFDVSKLAASFGGGGHKPAAGFTLDSIDLVLGARHA